MRQILFIVVAVACFCAIELRAQSTNAAVTGYITDSNKAVIVGAKVIVINVDTNARYEAFTNNAGSYDVVALPPGRYRIEVEKPGFKTVVKSGLSLHIQDSVALNFDLAVGSSAEIVTVSANDVHMSTDSAALGLLVDRMFLENMPLNGRSLDDLVGLTPGATQNGGAGYSFNGQRVDANYFTVDGVAANTGLAVVRPGGPGSAVGFLVAGTAPAITAIGTSQALVAVDALQEFKVQTSEYSAEFGRQPGGQIELRTRSGTNDFHGSLSEYLRNEAFDANSWTNNHYGIPKAPERQNDFGGTFGGPVIIPKLYNGRSKSFFFVSYEGLRLKVPAFDFEYVPTKALRQSVASAVQPFLNAFPLPNGPDQGNGSAVFMASHSNPSNVDAFSFRFDQAIGGRFQLFARYADTPTSSAFYLGGGAFTNQIVNQHGITVGGMMKVSSNMLNDVRFSYTNSIERTGYYQASFGGATPFSPSLIVPPQYGNSYSAFVHLEIPNTFVTNATLGYSTAPTNKIDQYNLTNGTNWQRGRHSVKFGLDYRRIVGSIFAAPYSAIAIIDSSGAIQQGYFDSASVSIDRGGNPVFQNLSLYGQDHWLVSRALTLDYGLRWEFNPPPGAVNGLYPLAVNQVSNLATMQLAPTGVRQYRTTYDNFAPRLGLAYQGRQSQVHPIVVRSGIGVFYDTGQNQAASGYRGYPFQTSVYYTNVPLPLTTGALAPPSLNVPLTPPYPDLDGIDDPNLKLPFTTEWNLSVDTALSTRNTLTVSYVGNRGHRLLFDGHYFLPAINPHFTDAFIITNASFSSYNALQILDQGYVGRALQIIGSYTWAHAIDDLSTSGPQIANYPAKGNSDFDIRQIFNAAINYELPGSSRNRFVGGLTEGWLLANRFVAETGQPVNLEQGLFPNVEGQVVSIQPDLVPHVPIYLHGVKGVPRGWTLNPAAFRPVPVDSSGVPTQPSTLGRNYIHGPNFWALNTSVGRIFPVWERLEMKFRVDAFNILNKANLVGPDPRLTYPTFGQLWPYVQTLGTSNPLYATGSARSVQLSLQLQF